MGNQQRHASDTSATASADYEPDRRAAQAAACTCHPPPAGGLVIAASLGECAHVAGILKFLEVARQAGFHTELVGQAISPQDFVRAVEKRRPDVAAVGYRLSGSGASAVLAELTRALEDRLGVEPRTGGRLLAEDGWRLRLVFGGTPETARVARGLGIFDAVFAGGEPAEAVRGYLLAGRCPDIEVPQVARGIGPAAGTRAADHRPGLEARIDSRKPCPLIRHHFGPPTVEEAVTGAERIAEARVLDILSLAPDQNAQRFFFHPERMDPSRDGAGGTPYRSEEDLRKVRDAARTGNFPLLRCYSGTDDVFDMAEVLLRAIDNAWAAIPMCWYSRLDRRGPRSLEESVAQSLDLVGWHALRGIPVEINEAHQWSLRRASDTVAVAAFYLAAINARARGVRTYVAQFMLNTPPGTSVAMDLAKMLAKIDMVRSLESEDFRVVRQVRAGLLAFTPDGEMGRATLAASTLVGMALEPEIVHVVSWCEAQRAATAEDVIAGCRFASHVIGSCLSGLPRWDLDPAVEARRRQLVSEARVLLDAIGCLGGTGVRSPLTDPGVIARAVRVGLLDAPEIVWDAGDLPQPTRRFPTRMVAGACVSVDPESGLPISESRRCEELLAAALS